MSDLPGLFTVRLTLEHMRQDLVQAVAAHSTEMSEEIVKGVNAAFDGFDFEAEIKREAESVIREKVRYAVKVATAEAMRTKGFDEHVEDAAKKAADEWLRATKGGQR